MASHYLHKWYRSRHLPYIAYALNVPEQYHKEVCAILHLAFKEYLGVKSTADFNDNEFICFMSFGIMIMARERGIMIPFFSESLDLNEMTMREWLEHALKINN